MRVGRGVDVEHVRRADDRDQDAGEGGPSRARRPLSPLDDRVRLARPCARRRRRARGGSAAAPRSTARRNSRARRRSTRSSGKESRPASCRSGIASISGARPASPSTIVVRAPRLRDERPARNPEQRDRQDLDREDDAHLRRRPCRDEHEPGQREERHLRAERGDPLCREQSDQGTTRRADRSPLT